MNTPPAAGQNQIRSQEYWRRIFQGRPDFCSWQEPKQLCVKDAVRDCLSERPGVLRVLDFGIGSMGLYRSLEDELMRRVTLTGVSESLQHDPADPLLARYPIEIAIGPGLSPLAKMPSASQDRVVCSYVFGYLSDQMRADALRAFARVLVGGGKLILVLHHPRGKRADKFRRSQPYWQQARELYRQLLQARYAEASALLHGLTDLLDASFAHDRQYRGYLASYLTTAERFISVYCPAGHRARPACEAALSDCERTLQLIGRELAMTCQSLRPIAHPARSLPLPGELTLTKLIECADPTDGLPIAHVLTAVRRDGVAYSNPSMAVPES